jgi:hypothetical protein
MNKEEKYEDPRVFLKQILDYVVSGVSPSEFRGAHEDIDKLIAQANPKHELAKLFDLSIGRDIVGAYRHLDPADSSVNLVLGQTDRYYRPEGAQGQKQPIDEILYSDALRKAKLGDFASLASIADYLATKRNQ